MDRQRITGTLSLERRPPPTNKGTGVQADPLMTVVAEPAELLNLDSTERNALQSFAALLWADRNRWSVDQARGGNALRSAGRAMGARV